MTNVALLLSVIAIVVTAGNLLLSVGNARRLRRVADRRPSVEPGGLTDGKRLPELVRNAINEVAGQPDRFVMVVATSSCPACQNLAKALNRRQSYFDEVPLVIVDSSEPGSAQFSALLEFPATVLRDERKLVYSAMEVNAVPYSFVVGNDRILRHALGDTIDDLLTGAVPAGAPARNGH